MVTNRLGRKERKLLKQVDGYIANEDWEKGTADTFAAIFLKQAQKLPNTIGNDFLEDLASKIEDHHSREGGSHYEFHDIARQQFLAEMIVLTLQSSLQVRHAKPNLSSRVVLITHIETLIFALQENVDVLDLRRNVAPTFDLALQNDELFLKEVRRLIGILENLMRFLDDNSASRHENQLNLAELALRSFVGKLSESLAEGVSKTITWGAKLALAWFAVGILKDELVPVVGTGWQQS